MNCLPLYFGKVESLDVEGNEYYSTFNIFTGKEQSFNDQPAVVYFDNYLVWKNKLNQYHRDYNKPAIVFPNKTLEYWINGEKVE